MERVIGGVLSAKTRVVVSSFAPCVAAAQRVITLEGGQAIHGAGAEAPRHGHAAAPDAGRNRPEDERWQVRHASGRPRTASSVRPGVMTLSSNLCFVPSLHRPKTGPSSG